MENTRLHELNQQRIDAALHVFALCALLLLAAQSLDQSELTNAEGVQALRVLAPMEGAPQAGPAGPMHSVLRAFALIAGTTERSLRTPGVGALVLAALLSSMVAARLFGPRGRAAALLAWCSFGVFRLKAELDPELFSALPVALFCGLLLPAPRHRGWLLAALAGAALTPLCAPQLVPAVLLLALFAALGVLPAGRSFALSAAMLAALALPWALGATPLWNAPTSPVSGSADIVALILGIGPVPFTAIGLLANLVLLGTVGVGCGTLNERPRAWLPLLFGVLVLALIAFTTGGFQWDGGRFAALLPLLALFAAMTCASLPARVARIGLLCTLSVVAGWALLRPGADAGTTALRTVLMTARDEGASGSRLILSGPDRCALSYYSRRGHDPGFPILLCPEDVAPDELAAFLEHALGAPAGADNLPPVLLWAPEGSKFPGLHARRQPGIGLAHLIAAPR